MLASLSIRNILLFENQHIEFGNGLNVLTGETGAGKSVLLDCIGYVLGERQSTNLFTTNKHHSEITAVFHLKGSHTVYSVLEECGIPTMDELVLRRVVNQNGRSSSFVNDSRCTTAILRRLGHVLMEVHGQDANRRQLSPGEHRLLLDNYANADETVSKVGEAWLRLKDAEQSLAEAESNRVKAENEIAFLKHALNEILNLDPIIGEEANLVTRRAELKTFQNHQEDLKQATEAIGISGAEGMAANAIRWLQKSGANTNNSIREILEAVDRAMLELNEANRLLDQLKSQFDADPHEIERVEERLHEIRRIARKHQISPDSLPDLVAKFTDELNRQKETIANANELPDIVKQRLDDYWGYVQKLSKIRYQAAKRLDKLVNRELPALKLKTASFHTEISRQEAGPHGKDGIVFMASTNVSTPSGPIHLIASGGEFSRFMLAMKVCLTSRNTGITMIFDEVDRDVGGATADAIGRRLQSLAAETQLLVVTHSPQVAAYGNCHLRIEKHTANNCTKTQVTTLSESQRISEIARMLSGETISNEAKAAAVALLKESRVNNS